MKRNYNFSAGPSVLPLAVLEQLRDTILEHHGQGVSIIETSHRGPMYEEVHYGAIKLIRSLLAVPDSYEVLLLAGGATLQFSMVPLNLLADGGTCGFVISGAWAKKAYEDARKIGKVTILFDGAEHNYSTLPRELSCPKNLRYLHLTSNETIDGLQLVMYPKTDQVPLVVDMSSDIMSRPIPFDDMGILYAGAQKNLGPAGVTLVIIKKDILDRCSGSLTAYLSYKIHAEKKSLYNTPPVFSIYALKLVMQWVKEQGGVVEMKNRASKKSGIIYEIIDKSDGFYVNAVDPDYRSKMNVTFRLGNQEQESLFLEEAARAGMQGLTGHRSVGGVRVSLYNGLPMQWAEDFAGFMVDFQKQYR